MLHALGHSSCHKDSLICPHARNVVLMHAAQARLWVMCCVLGDSNRCAQHCAKLYKRNYWVWKSHAASMPCKHCTSSYLSHT